jgi:single-stranded-DNA-specific exonuclease
MHLKYKLTGNNDTTNILKTVLNNRGIENYNKYLALCDNCSDDWNNLDNVDDAVTYFNYHLSNHHSIAILQDTDPDGVCSSTIMYQYIKLMDADYPVSIVVHKQNKSHGLAFWDFDIPDNTKLLIIPDAGSNDVDECKKLINDGIGVIVLDHHQVSTDKLNPAVVVNNQTSNGYPNKEACGAHVTYNFLQALDDYYWNDFCEEYFTDLVALADISDVMSMKSFNTRAMVNYGIDNINNKMFKEILNAQEFSTKGIVSPFTIAFYVTPLINAFLRSATYEERQILARAFYEDESEFFEHTKRGDDFPTAENIYQHCVRLMKSYKGKQDRARDKAYTTFISQNSDSDDKIAIIDATGVLDSAYTGLVAIKLSEALNKPVLLVRKVDDGFAGSGRSFDYCPIEDFRAMTELCPETVFAQGHPSAYGVELKDINKAREWFNENLKDVSFEKIYVVDFIVDAEDVSISWCQELDKYKSTFAHGVDEPLWLIKDLYISNDNAKIVGKNDDTIQIYDEDTNIKYVMFKCDESNEVFDWMNNNFAGEETYINVIGTLGINVYNGQVSPQVLIKECEIRKD